MEIRRIDNNTYDVFMNTQWDEHSRVRKGRSSTYVVSGNKLPHALLKELHGILAPNMPINYGQGLLQTLDNCHILHQQGV